MNSKDNSSIVLGEHTKKTAHVNPSSDRSFGLVFSFVFMMVAIYPLISGNPIKSWAIGIVLVLITISLLTPRMLNPFNRWWTIFGGMLHAIVSPVTLALIFYLVVTPTGLVLRIFKKKSLYLDFDPDSKSYWVGRDPAGPTAHSLNNQF